MDTLENVTNQMKGVEGQLSQYGANLPSEINTQIQNAYTPALQQSLDVTKNQMGDYLGRYFDTTSMGPGMAGTTAKDLSPTQKLGVMGRELGTMSGQLQASSKYSDYLGAQMNDMYGKALQAAQMGQQALADQYNRLGQQQQMLWQQAEAEKDRALQMELASRSGGGGGFSLGDLLGDSGDNGESTTPQLSAKQQAVIRLQKMANAVAGMRNKGNKFSLNGQVIGDVNDVHKYLSNLAQTNYGINLNPEWLWQMLGNTAATPQTQMAIL